MIWKLIDLTISGYMKIAVYVVMVGNMADNLLNFVVNVLNTYWTFISKQLGESWHTLAEVSFNTSLPSATNVSLHWFIVGTCDKPMLGAMIDSSLQRLCVTRLRWVNMDIVVYYCYLIFHYFQSESILVHLHYNELLMSLGVHKHKHSLF